MKAIDMVVQVFLADGEDSGLDSESDHAEGEDNSDESEENKENKPRNKSEIELCKSNSLISIDFPK